MAKQWYTRTWQSPDQTGNHREPKLCIWQSSRPGSTELKARKRRLSSEEGRGGGEGKAYALQQARVDVQLDAEGRYQNNYIFKLVCENKNWLQITPENASTFRLLITHMRQWTELKPWPYGMVLSIRGQRFVWKHSRFSIMCLFSLDTSNYLSGFTFTATTWHNQLLCMVTRR